MVKKLPDVLIRFEPVTDEGVASLAGSGRYDRKSSGIYIVKVYDESGALLAVPGATRSDFKVRCICREGFWPIRGVRQVQSSGGSALQTFACPRS